MCKPNYKKMYLISAEKLNAITTNCLSNDSTKSVNKQESKIIDDNDTDNKRTLDIDSSEERNN